jgi:hypothetical protein
MKFVRQRLHISGKVGTFLPDSVQLLSYGPLPAADALGYLLNLHGEHRKALTDIVV